MTTIYLFAQPRVKHVCADCDGRCNPTDVARLVRWNARQHRRTRYSVRMRSLCDTIGGLFALFMLAARSGFNMRSSYWRWRNETAFGSGSLRRPSLAQRLRAMLEYGRWVHRMKRRL